MKKIITLAIAASLMAVPFSGATAPSKAPHAVRLHVQRVAAINNVDRDILKADRADFYVSAAVGGKWERTKTVFGKDRTNPNWLLTFPVQKNLVKMTIRLYDDDLGLEGRDDRCDINPHSGARELQLILNLRTGVISGDVQGRRGQPITAIGYGDDNRAKLTFVLDW